MDNNIMKPENKKVEIFSNDNFGSIRGIEIDGEGWLVGRDVAKTLGYKNISDALKKHVDDCYSIQRVLYSYCLIKWLKMYMPKLSEQEKASKLLELKEKELNDKIKAFENEKLLNETSKQLASKNLPIQFAEMLKGNDAEKTFENIQLF